MKIITSGITKRWTKVLYCSGAGHSEEGCGAELEVSLADIFRTGTKSPAATFACPECGTLTNVNSPEYPSSFASLLPTEEERKNRK